MINTTNSTQFQTNISSEKNQSYTYADEFECKVFPSSRPTLYPHSVQGSQKSLQQAYVEYVLTGRTQVFDTPEYKSIVTGMSDDRGRSTVGIPKYIFPHYEQEITSFPFLKQAVILENSSDAYISISRQKQAETVFCGIEEDLVDRMDDFGIGVSLQHENKPWLFLMNHKALGHLAATNNDQIIPWCMRSAARALNRQIERICFEGYVRDDVLVAEGLLYNLKPNEANSVSIKEINNADLLLQSLFILISLYSASHLSQAFWLMNPNQAARCMTLLKKDNTTLMWGNFQQGVPLTLLGLPVYLSSFVPEETPIILTCQQALQVFFKEYPLSMRRQDGYKRIDLLFISFVQTVVTTHIEDSFAFEKNKEPESKKRPLICVLKIEKIQQED